MSLFQKDERLRKQTRRQPIRGGRPRDTGNRDIITLFLFSSSGLIQPCRRRSPSLPLFLPPYLPPSLTPNLSPLSSLSSSFTSCSRASSFPFSPGPCSHPVCFLLPPSSASSSDLLLWSVPLKISNMHIRREHISCQMMINVFFFCFFQFSSKVWKPSSFPFFLITPSLPLSCCSLWA